MIIGKFQQKYCYSKSKPTSAVAQHRLWQRQLSLFQICREEEEENIASDLSAMLEPKNASFI
jgi:hypothetical protein